MAKEKSKKQSMLSIPQRLVEPVYHFLVAQLGKLDRRKKDLEDEDPFKDEGRVVDNASPDTDAAEQFGHARIKAIKEELEKKSNQIKKAIKRIRRGKYGICEVCGQMIDTDRLAVYPEATVCVKCESRKEKKL